MSRGIQFRAIAIAITLVVMLGSMVAAGEIEDNLTYQGGKARISVGNIKAKADHCSHDMAAAIGEMMSTALVNTGKFIVLASQEETAELAEEIDFAQSGYVEEGRGAEKGLMEGADLLITGAVTTFEPDAGGGGGMLGGISKKAFGKVGVSSKKAKMAVEVKLIDIRTRRVLKAKTVTAESKKWKTSMTGGGWVEDVALVGGLSQYSNEPMEDAIRATLAKSIEMISKEVPKEYYRYQGQGQYTQEYGKSGGQAQSQASATAGNAATSGAATASAAVTTAPAAEDMTLYTKYDFIPGDRVIFYDDMKNDEEGEFPYRWKLEQGVYEVARLGKEFWILATDDGNIRPNMPDAPLPEKYTVEYEYYDKGQGTDGNYHYIFWVDAEGKNIACFGVYGDKSTWMEIGGKTISDKPLDARPPTGIQTMRIMATSRSIKCYVNETRVANIPKVDGFAPVGFRLHHRPYANTDNPVLFRGFRFAEGGKSMRAQLEENGKIVTHGILFDSDSHKIKAESFKTLKEIGRLFEDDPELRLSIEGHTDTDGSDTHNAELSKSRADAVRNYLIATYGVNPANLEAKGWGESKPIDSNDSAEGKANNRRVELVQL